MISRCTSGVTSVSKQYCDDSFWISSESRLQLIINIFFSRNRLSLSLSLSPILEMIFGTGTTILIATQGLQYGTAPGFILAPSAAAA